MKRWICLLLAILCLPLWGCQEEETPLLDPFNGYYRRAELTHGSADSVIAALPIEGAGLKGDHLALLNIYLSHRPDPFYAPTFPEGTQLLIMELEYNTADLLLSSNISELSGLDLTVACVCLTKTVIELTGVDTVIIRARGTTLDGASYISMDLSSIYLLDDYEPETT
ncbi:MAG: hypothetical protein E7436_05375 [Ruminococcaceae bacterium]|nr:hypothetical protein [Oscillospiraceae bacterium]